MQEQQLDYSNSSHRLRGGGILAEVIKTFWHSSAGEWTDGQLAIVLMTVHFAALAVIVAVYTALMV